MTALREMLDMIEEAIRVLENPHDEEAETVKAAAELVADMCLLAEVVMFDDH